MKIIGITGSRPQNLPGGFNIPNPTYNYICQNIQKIFEQIQPSKIITGLALGVDQYAAAIAIKLKIPYVAAVPFLGQEDKWNDHSKKIYQKLLDCACEIVIVSEGGYSARKLHLRNEFIVNHSDLMLAVLPQNVTSGGTFSCCKYAESQGKEIIYIRP